MISVDEFADFFAAIHDGERPFAWQEELLHALVNDGCWPDQIAAPTGSGKSAVVEIHVFANALAACGQGARVPRRLAVVVNRRALTDAHADRAAQLQRLLKEAPDGGVVARVREALASLWVEGRNQSGPLMLAVMRGAAAIDRDWLDAPEACGVLCMTPAMWGSSLLFRSYGAWPFARPRLAGLLALDAAVVVDEAHLSRQLLVTARRVAELVGASAHKLGVPALQAVEMTATPTSNQGRVVAVTEQAVLKDSCLAARVGAPKSVLYVPTGTWPTNGKMTQKYLEVIVDQVATQVAEAQSWAATGPRTVGCVLNRVDSAIRVAQALRERGLRCRTWVGRMRPWDLKMMRREDPDLFTTVGSDQVDVLIATQTVEVGVDLDLAALVTELASGSAIAQRAGRVNRMARRQRGPVVVVGPELKAKLADDVLPYQAADLRSARAWVLERQAVGDLSPLAVVSAPPPAEEPRRILWQRPEPWDVNLWARTSQRLVIEPELDLWLRDDLDPEVDGVGVVLRELAQLPDSLACESLLRELEPQDEEVFPTNIGALRELVRRIAEVKSGPLERSVLWRDGAPFPSWQALVDQGEDKASRELRPGDLLVLDSGVPLLTENVVTSDGKEKGHAVPLAAFREFAGKGASLVSDVVGVVTDPEELKAFADLTEEEIAARLGGTIALPPGWQEGEAPAWVVVRDANTVSCEADQHSMLSARGRVGLEEHNAAVAQRALAFGRSLGVAEQVSGLLAEAGRWHDVGKADVRFQRALWRKDPEGCELLAKSGATNPKVIKRAWADSGLPGGWRHELASAAAYWDSCEAAGQPVEDRELVTRLVGTSHGRGRPMFDHSVEQAGPGPVEALAELIGEGEWESVVARTDRNWGPWGTAYLEGLLRAAGCTISAEGK
ncbi:helicase Cas3 [Actinomyces bovis]|uniref:Helicase Cas3 n=1 Tax=Actinomyces bovis TaxID=1658 RepID=A0ABY1VQS2_9ACTO|nr:type I-U CRISPR-associated helicase/endonuclease Cas3 [Actinomyces bovis]SPT55027.1 helicase Cas3 [Actinomyces bovis]VEG56174.1 helicase Cas3 [Actinomyces israelii]